MTTPDVTERNAEESRFKYTRQRIRILCLPLLWGAVLCVRWFWLSLTAGRPVVALRLTGSCWCRLCTPNAHCTARELPEGTSKSHRGAIRLNGYSTLIILNVHTGINAECWSHNFSSATAPAYSRYYMQSTYTWMYISKIFVHIYLLITHNRDRLVQIYTADDITYK